MSERTCGSCTLCCKLLRVTELNKAEGRWCTHCVKGQGCGIYADRPPSCRNFECFWLMDAGFPDDMRPDRTGIVIMLHDENSAVLHVDPARPDAQRQPAAQEWIDGLLRVYERVFIVCGPERAMVKRP
jgi:hypothetical protein